ncbi:MAG: cation:proton antiporter [Victivallaceae bacterium]|nr:cation:proton antiporter [Victivallaceae bacterium]
MWDRFVAWMKELCGVVTESTGTVVVEKSILEVITIQSIGGIMIGLLLGAILCGIFAKIDKIKFPALVSFLFIGIAGSQIYPSCPAIEIEKFGTLALSFILFYGGLTTNFRSLDGIKLCGIGLATVGVIVTSVVFGCLACWLLPKCCPPLAGLPTSWFFLLGATIASTDAAMVLSILRGRGIRLRKRKLSSLLELESGSNDPMAYICTFAMIGVMAGTAACGPIDVVGRIFTLANVISFVLAIFGGVIVGVVMALLARTLFRLPLTGAGMYPILGVIVVILTYCIGEFDLAWFGFGKAWTVKILEISGSPQIGEPAGVLKFNGMIACYSTGVVLSYFKIQHQYDVMKFSDGFAWLLQALLFLFVGFSVDLSGTSWGLCLGGLVALLLLIVARFVAMFPWCLFCRIGESWRKNAGVFQGLPGWREWILVWWVGIRGAAPVVLAIIPISRGVEGSDMLMLMVFLIVVYSSILGLSIKPVADALGLVASDDENNDADSAGAEGKPKSGGAAVQEPQSVYELDVVDWKMQYDDFQRQRKEAENAGNASAVRRLDKKINELVPGTDSECLVGMSVKDIGSHCAASGWKVLIVVIRRDGDDILPKADAQVRDGDTLVVLCSSRHLEEMTAHYNIRHHANHWLMPDVAAGIRHAMDRRESRWVTLGIRDFFGNVGNTFKTIADKLNVFNLIRKRR